MKTAKVNPRVAEILNGAIPPGRRLWWTIAAGFASEASAVALLAVSAWLIVRASEQPPVMYLTFAVVGVRFFAIARATFRYVDRLTGHDATLRQLSHTRAELVRKLVPLAPDGLHRTRRGSALTALVDDVDELQNLPLRVIEPLVTSATVALGAVILVTIIWWPAGLALLLCLCVAAFIAIAWGWWRGAAAERAVAPLRAKMVDSVLDYLHGFDVLSAYGAEASARASIHQQDAELSRAIHKRASAQAGSTALVSLLAGTASLLAVLALLPVSGLSFPSGPSIAVVVLIPMAVFEVFSSLPLAAASWRGVLASAERINEIVPEQTPPELLVSNPDATPEPVRLGSGLRAERIGVRWPGATRDAINDVSFDLRPGERLLIVGASGAGKTSLAHTLVRFLDNSGSLTINGRDVHEFEADEIRRVIGLCEQHPMMFDESIRQNLLFARDDASDAELIDVLDRVGLADWLEERGGLDSRVGERGSLVSGGQAQRIALARALLHDFPVLVLDEPTAGVDPATGEALLQELLAAIDPEKSVILISHIDVPDALIDQKLVLSN